MAAKLYKPINIYVRPVPKNHKESALKDLKKNGVNPEWIMPSKINKYEAILYNFSMSVIICVTKLERFMYTNLRTKILITYENIKILISSIIDY